MRTSTPTGYGECTDGIFVGPDVAQASFSYRMSSASQIEDLGRHISAAVGGIHLPLIGPFWTPAQCCAGAIEGRPMWPPTYTTDLSRRRFGWKNFLLSVCLRG